MNNFAIIVIGYNRVNNMKRVLNSIEYAHYSNYDVTLIISIDNSGTDDVEKIARQFNWSHGKKKIITYKEKQGLRNHILKCSSLVKDYDAVAILEDDVIVSPGFFHYMECTYKKYSNVPEIAGVSLYSYQWNENVCLPFEADLSSFDVYFMQMSQSWGQIWFKNQWKDFEKWYELNKGVEINNENVPETVSKWSNNSWKKYHIKYCIENNKYMVFPYKSLSTCFSDVGVHCKKQHTYLQVSILNDDQKRYKLPNLDDKNVVFYDAFFERKLNNISIGGIDSDDICFDLYSSKKNYENKQYLVTTKALPFQIVKKFGMLCKPQEQNVIQNISGNEIIMYNINVNAKKEKINNKLKIFRYRYNLYDKAKLLFKCIIDSTFEYLKNKIKK